MKRMLRWISEVPTVVAVLPLFDGLRPLMSLRFGRAKNADVRIRGRSVISIPGPISAMVFANIWIRHVYPDPRPGDVVLDLGTNIGMFSLYALHHGVKFVHCVEPCPDSVSRIEKHMREWGFSDRVNIIAAGVAERSGEAFIPAASDVANTVQTQANIGTVPVKLLDVAALLDSLQPRPTYIKCDIESNEVPVIRRLITSPALASVHTITMEVDVASEEKELEELLQKAGFIVEIRHAPETIITGRRLSSK
jgi:FkbM family methyltransferase